MCIKPIAVVFISVSNKKSDMSEGNPVADAIRCAVHIEHTCGSVYEQRSNIYMEC